MGSPIDEAKQQEIKGTNALRGRLFLSPLDLGALLFFADAGFLFTPYRADRSCTEDVHRSVHESLRYCSAEEDQG